MNLDDVLKAHTEFWLLEDLIPARGIVDCALHEGSPFFPELVGSVLTKSPMFGCDIVAAQSPSVVYASADPSGTALCLNRAIRRQGYASGDLLLLPLLEVGGVDAWVSLAATEAPEATLVIVEDASFLQTGADIRSLEEAFPHALLLLGNLSDEAYYRFHEFDPAECDVPPRISVIVDCDLDPSECAERELMLNLRWREIEWREGDDHIIWSFVYEDSPTKGMVYDARLSFRANGGGA